MHKAPSSKPLKQRKVVKQAKPIKKAQKKHTQTKSQRTITSTRRTSTLPTPTPLVAHSKSTKFFAPQLTQLTQAAKLNFAPITTTKRFGGWGYTHFTPAEDIEHRIIDILKALPAVDQTKLTPKAHFAKDLGLDSLQQVELIMMFEQHFRVEINDDDAIHIASVPEAVHYFSHTPYTV
jgi:acyl carrier protein